MNLIQIATSLRIVRIWVQGNECAALVAYRRAVGEVVHSVYRVA